LVKVIQLMILKRMYYYRRARLLTYLNVYNDDSITFDWVITCFTDILKHSVEQSEQLAYIIHYTGKAAVKVGPYDTLHPYKEALIDRGLSAVIA